MIEALKVKLGAEVEALRIELNITLPAEIARAVEMGDLRENSECGVVLHSVVLYCVMAYCVVLCCMYCIVLYCVVLYCVVLYCTVLHCTVLYCLVCYQIF